MRADQLFPNPAPLVVDAALVRAQIADDALGGGAIARLQCGVEVGVAALAVDDQ